MPPRRLLAAPILAALVAFLLAATACSSVTKPEGWASPASGDGLLLIAHADKLYALDAQTLAAKWQFPSPQQKKADKISPTAIYGTPVVADGLVYVPGYDGTLYALKEDSGDVDWSADTGGPLIGGVAVSDGTVYFGSDDGKVYALDAKSGDERWAPFKAGGEGVWSTPVVSGATLYVTSLDRRLYALDLATGIEKWSFKTDAGLASIPVVEEASGAVYVGGFDSQMRAIDIATQQELWKAKAKNWFWARPLVSDNVVYAASLDGKVYALDATTGKAHWKPFDTGAAIRSTPMIVAGALIVVNKDGNVYSLDPGTGASKAGALAIGADVLTDPLGRTLDNGGQELLLVTNGGELVRVDPGTLRVVGRKLLSGG